MFQRRNIIILLLLLFAFIPSVKALSGKVTYSSTELNIGETKEISISIINPSDVQAIGGFVKPANGECFKINSVSNPGISGLYDYNINNNKLAILATDTLKGDTKIMNVSITGLKGCTTKLEFDEFTISSPDQTETNATIVANAIKVNDPTVQTLTNTTPSNSTNTTSDSSNTTTNVVKASTKNEQKEVTTTSNNNTQSSNSNVNNTQSNDTTSNIANTSIDLSLSSLIIDGYDINFSKNQLDYILEVENNVETINIDAKATDSNSNVRIEGNENLLVGENIIKIIVSNNNQEKVYTIKVNKLQDPNKVYNTDNYLLNIIPSIGILSPKFDKDVLNYIVYIPYEENNITFETTLSAPDTSIVDIEGPNELVVGDNKYIIKVRAESGDIKEYNVIVRKTNMYGISSNNYLKSITLTNGKLLSEFDKDTMTYYYTKNDGFKYDFILDDPNSTVNVYENDGTITIVVEALNGDKRVYTLIEKKSNIIKVVLLVILSIVMGYLIKCLFIEMKKSKKRKKKKQLEMNK